jgi:hypothetical protein
VALSGQRKGARFSLGSGITTIGRGDGSAVLLSDVSVSRRHAHLVREGGRFVLHDQGSGNGTRVNGKPVQRRTLRHGDEIELGDVKLRFVLPRRTRLPLRGVAVAGALLAALAVMASAVLLQQERESRLALEARVKAAERARAEEAQRAAQAEARVEEAQALRTPSPDQPRQEPPAAPEPPPAVARRAAARASQEPRQQDRPSAGRERGSPGGERSDLREAMDAYRSGYVAEAARLASLVEGPRGEALLERLRAVYVGRKEAAALQREQKLPEALRALAQACAADRIVDPGRGGPVERDLAKLLSSLHARMAASLLATDKGLPEAASHLRAALEANPAEPDAAALSARIGERCRELYLRGYIAKDADAASAREAFQVVAAALPAGDPTAQKARRWLERLDGKAAVDE